MANYKVEFTRGAIVRLPLTNRSKWQSNGHQLRVNQRQSDDHACISSASSKRQPMTTQIHNRRFTKFAFDLNTGSGKLTEVNKIIALIGHCVCAAWKHSACSDGSQLHSAAGLAEVNAHLSSTDSGTARVNTPLALFSIAHNSPQDALRSTVFSRFHPPPCCVYCCHSHY